MEKHTVLLDLSSKNPFKGQQILMTKQPGFNAFEKRIEELLEKSSDISPASMLNLLRRADSNPSLDVAKEMERLRTASSATKDE